MRFCGRLGNEAERAALVDRDVIGLIALDQVMWLFLGSVVGVALELRVGRYFLEDDSADAARFGVLAHMVADFECFRHRESYGWLERISRAHVVKKIPRAGEGHRTDLAAR